MSKVKVSRAAWQALEQVHKQMLAKEPILEKRWLDQCVTSNASTVAGGIAKLETDYDWLLLFFAWRNGVAIPRDA